MPRQPKKPTTKNELFSCLQYLKRNYANDGRFHDISDAYYDIERGAKPESEAIEETGAYLIEHFTAVERRKMWLSLRHNNFRAKDTWVKVGCRAKTLNLLKSIKTKHFKNKSLDIILYDALILLKSKQDQ